MKLIPILFSTPMVQAILSGNKSMTRRTMKLQPGEGERYEAMGEIEFAYISKGGISGPYKCPYGQPGDVLWVRETFVPPLGYGTINSYLYKSRNDIPKTNSRHDIKWKPNIHMPFEACRIFLRVKEIRVERLHDITPENITREGVLSAFTNPKMGVRHENAISMEFERLWISINGADSWNANPWVWAISFARITNANEIAAIRKQWNERRAK